MTRDDATGRDAAPGLLLAVLGALAAWLGLQWLSHWSQIATGLRTHAVSFVGAGIPLVLAGAARLRGRLGGVAARVGAAAAAVCGLNLLSGIAMGNIPCSSPT